MLSPDYEKYKAKVTSLCYVYREVTAKMFVRSDAYKFKVDAEIGEDSGKRQKKKIDGLEHVSLEKATKGFSLFCLFKVCLTGTCSLF